MNTLIVASDNPMLRENLKELIDLKRDLYATNCSCTLKAISKSLETFAPQFTVIDLICDFDEKLHLCMKMKEIYPSMHLIGLSNSMDRSRFIEAFRCGVDGYLTGEGIFNELSRCVFTLLQGEKYLSLSMVNNVLDYMIETPHLDGRRPGLITKREKEHIACIAEGLNSKEIAYKMNISKKTADNYRNRIMDKLNCSSVVDIVKYAIKEQIVSL